MKNILRNIKIFDNERRQIGLIKEEGNINIFNKYTFYNENNRIIKTIEKNILPGAEGCCNDLFKYTFYDENRNIEGIVNQHANCCNYIMEETDKYDSSINWGRISGNCRNAFFGEFDNEGNVKYKISYNYGNKTMFKLYDSNDMEYGNKF